jgi:hypothetical protein
VRVFRKEILEVPMGDGGDGGETVHGRGYLLRGAEVFLCKEWTNSADWAISSA